MKEWGRDGTGPLKGSTGKKEADFTPRYTGVPENGGRVGAHVPTSKLGMRCEIYIVMEDSKESKPTTSLGHSSL